MSAFGCRAENICSVGAFPGLTQSRHSRQRDSQFSNNLGCCRPYPAPPSESLGGLLDEHADAVANSGDARFAGKAQEWGEPLAIGEFVGERGITEEVC